LPKTVDRRILEEIILQRIGIQINLLNPENVVSAKTTEATKLKPDFLKKYNLISPIKSYNMNSFLQMGLEDPFPSDDLTIIGSYDDDDYKIPACVHDNVYSDCRYYESCSPLCIYIPRKELMFKLMRACVEVKQTNELWFNSNIRKAEVPRSNLGKCCKK